MHIGVVTEYYYPSIGGIQEHVHNFALDARRLGHTVKIVTSAMPDVSREAGAVARRHPDRRQRARVPERRVRPGHLRAGASRAPCARCLLASGSTWSTSTRRSPRYCPLLAIHHATGPVVGTFHTHFRPSLLFRLMRRGLQRYLDRLDAAVAVSRACLTGFEGRLRAHFRIIPNGVDAEFFARGSAICPLRRRPLQRALRGAARAPQRPRPAPRGVRAAARRSSTRA